MKEVHVVGAGLAGLAAALAAADAGWHATVYEAGPAPGGRCRSYFDRELGCRIDNGNHLLLSGNGAAMIYLERIGARASMVGPASAAIPFADLATGDRWLLRPSPGRIPWWVLRRSRRVPGTRLREYISLLALRRAGAERTVASVLDDGGKLYRRLLEPLAIASLNTPPVVAAACLLDAVISETLVKGGVACVPLVPRIGLSESFVDPAVATLHSMGAVIRTSSRIAELRLDRGHVTALLGPDGPVSLAPGARVILAVPPWVAGDLVPGLVVPDAFQSIVNVHFRKTVAAPVETWGDAGFVGVVGGTAEWVFLRDNIVSVTISAANRLADAPSATIATRVWADICAVLGLGATAEPPSRVVREKRATFAATMAQQARRPGADIGIANLRLAGDWTDTGLPATIEGAIRSGRTAARFLAGG